MWKLILVLIITTLVIHNMPIDMYFIRESFIENYLITSVILIFVYVIIMIFKIIKKRNYLKNKKI